MGNAAKKLSASWKIDESAMGLSEIFSSDNSVSIWRREENDVISDYFEKVFSDLGMGVRGVFSMESLKQELHNILPGTEGKQAVIDDIYLLSDMLTCLFDCDSVGLRIAPLNSAMCPRFHVDNIPVRLVNTYLGEGTEWLPGEAMSHVIPTESKSEMAKTSFGTYYSESHVQQMKAFDVGLLKGQAWEGHENMAAVHRSCQPTDNQNRILLTLDPL